MRDAMRLVALAFFPGLLSALAAGRLLRNILYESGATDLTSVAVATANALERPRIRSAEQRDVRHL